MANYYPPYSIRISVLLALVMCNIGTTAYAATGNFTLNFQPIPSERFSEPEWLNFNCNRGRGGGDFEDCDDNDEFRDNNGRDRTPFLMERLRGDNGDEYYHVIIGSPGDDFIQESYIKITSLFCGSDDDCDDLGPISDSLGESRDITERRNNAYDPRGPASFSGSGTANPTSTLFRQILTDSSNGMRQEFLKASFNQKHLLTFTLDADFIDLDFRLNMTNSTFTDAGTAGIIELHTLNNTDPNFAGIPAAPGSNILPTLPPSSNAFDIATDGDVNNVSGGKYEYISHGVYSGEGAGFDIFSADWDDFFDPAQNIGHLYGPENGND